MKDVDADTARERMVSDLVDRTNITDTAVIDALRTVPRHAFVPEAQQSAAYADRPLPIGEHQTISAPHMVARMTALLDLDAGDRVLEIGTGSGYHAAVLAEIVGDSNVYSIERRPSLAHAARDRLTRLGYDVLVRTDDGRNGWPDAAPFDAAVLTCAPPTLPSAIPAQLDVGGVIVAPVGQADQTLIRAVVRSDGTLERESHGAVQFVPLR